MGMMQAIRDQATGWIAWVIVILISIPFALWGIQEYVNPNPNVPVAEVNGQEISLQYYQQAYQRQRMRLQQMLGANFDPAALDEERFRRETLERLIRDELLVQVGGDVGLRVSDAQLVVAIQSQEAFRENNVFSQEAYDRWLSSQGFTPGSFEFEFRRGLLTEQLFAGIARSTIVTPGEVERALHRARQKRSYAELRISLEKYRDNPVSDEAVEAFYRANASRFMTPEMVKVAYVRLSRGDISKGMGVDEAEMRSRYETSAASYVEPEQRRARHILVTVAKDAEAEIVDAAKAKADELRKRIQSGEAFEEVAKAESGDPGSAAQGGDLGFFARGVMDPRFEDTVFSMQEGGTSEPARTDFGFHVIRLEEIRKGKSKSFEQVRDGLRSEIQREKSEQTFFEQAERLANLSFENPDTLEIAAEALGLKIEETDYFSRQGITGAAVAGDPAAVSAAFGTEVLEGGNNSELVELGGDRVLVLRVLDRKSPSKQELSEVRATIASELQSEAARTAVRALGVALLARLRAGERREDIAAEVGAEWVQRDAVTRGEAGLPGAARQTAFRMPRPTAQQPMYDGVEVGRGDFVLLALLSVEKGELDDSTGEERETLRETLTSELGRQDHDAVTAVLRGKANVLVNEQNL